MTTATIIYLHGFASGPNGRKPTWLRERYAALGIPFRAPDLNVPTFETLTVSAMIERVAEEVAACTTEQVYLIGSSLGGYVTLHYLNQHQPAQVTKACLLAPAVRKVWDDEEDWREIGWMPVYHFGYQEHRKLHYGYAEDFRRYDTFRTQIDIPLLILHGTADTVVPYQGSEDFAATYPNVELRLLEGAKHELLGELETIWSALTEFFALP